MLPAWCLAERTARSEAPLEMPDGRDPGWSETRTADSAGVIMEILRWAKK